MIFESFDKGSLILLEPGTIKSNSIDIQEIVIPDTVLTYKAGKVVVANGFSELKKDDIVLYVPGSGGRININGMNYIFLYNNDIICKLRDVIWEKQ